MDLLILYAAGLLGSIVWFVPVVPTCVLYARLGWNPVLVGLATASGQTLGYGLIYLGGEQLVRRWSRLARQVERTRARHGPGLERRYLLTSLLAALIALPPMGAMAAMAPGF